MLMLQFDFISHSNFSAIHNGTDFPSSKQLISLFTPANNCEKKTFYENVFDKSRK